MNEAVGPSVLALVATYLPGENLSSLVTALGLQVDSVVVSDDASPCTADPILRDCGLVSLLACLRGRLLARSLARLLA